MEYYTNHSYTYQVEMQMCSNEVEDWNTSQHKAMIANAILETLSYNNAPMTLIYIVQAVQHKFWMKPEVLKGGGVPAPPLYETVFQVLIQLHEAACMGNAQKMPVWHLEPF